MMSKLFKDYIPYLVDDQSDKEKRYPTQALKWKRFEDEKPKEDQRIQVIHDRICYSFVWYSECQTTPDEVWIEAEAYEAAKAKEEMWLPLGDGWSHVPNAKSMYENEEGVLIECIDDVDIYLNEKDFQTFSPVFSCNGNYCTLEIVQKLIENIKEMEK